MKLFICFLIFAFSLGAETVSYDARLTDYKYPFAVQYFDITSQGQNLQMAYMDLKPEKDMNKTIVLLHGKNFSGFYFESIARELLKKDYRVIIPDQIGFGKSSRPESFQYSFHILATFTKQLMSKLGVEKFSVLGHSMGGMLATRLALMFPENVEKLTLVCPIGLEDYKIHIPYKTVDESYEQELKLSAEKIKNYQMANYYQGTWKPEYEKLIEPAIGQIGHKDFPIVARNSSLTLDIIFTQPVIYEFDKLKMPVTLIIGLKDKTAPGKERAPEKIQKNLGDFTKLGRLMKKKLKQLKLVELKEYGHVPFIENFEAFKRYLE